jgi:hypothetical protein
MTDVSLFSSPRHLFFNDLLSSKKIVRIGERADNWIDKYRGFAVLESFNEGVLSKVSKNPNITALVPLNGLIMSDGAEKAIELQRIRTWVRFLQRYSIRFTFASFGKNEETMRDENEREMVCALFGLDEGQSKAIVSNIERIRD